MLEGFFTSDNHSDEGRAEVCIFRTETHQKIISCYEDTNKLQDKPVNKKNVKTHQHYHHLRRNNSKIMWSKCILIFSCHANV